MSAQLEERLDRFERTLSALRAELADLRRIAAGPKAPAPSPPRPPAPVSAPRWQLLDPAPAPRAAAPAAPPLSARIAEALGARALALTGGAVTLLGVVLLFALAVNRGWIGPWERCGIGFAASAAVFLGGLWLRRRYGTTYSALSAVGAGIGGAYASLLAAAALYHLLSPPAALVLAGAIAAVGVGTSIAWSAEIVAGFGLIGAMLVPPAVVFDGGLTVLGTSFVAIVLAAARGSWRCGGAGAGCAWPPSGRACPRSRCWSGRPIPARRGSPCSPRSSGSSISRARSPRSFGGRPACRACRRPSRCWRLPWRAGRPSPSSAAPARDSPCSQSAVSTARPAAPS